jgi:hypothetical protein
MVCMFALASVSTCTIESYYPVVNDQTPPEKWNSLSKMFNCTIHPRECLNFDIPENNVHIFRCATMPLDFLEKRKIPSRKNHFIALSKPQEKFNITSQHFIPKRSLPALPLLLTHIF